MAISSRKPSPPNEAEDNFFEDALDSVNRTKELLLANKALKHRMRKLEETLLGTQLSFLTVIKRLMAFSEKQEEALLRLKEENEDLQLERDIALEIAAETTARHYKPSQVEASQSASPVPSLSDPDEEPLLEPLSPIGVHTLSFESRSPSPVSPASFFSASSAFKPIQSRSSSSMSMNSRRSRGSSF